MRGVSVFDAKVCDTSVCDASVCDASVCDASVWSVRDYCVTSMNHYLRYGLDRLNVCRKNNKFCKWIILLNCHHILLWNNVDVIWVFCSCEWGGYVAFTSISASIRVVTGVNPPIPPRTEPLGKENRDKRVRAYIGLRLCVYVIELLVYKTMWFICNVRALELPWGRATVGLHYEAWVGKGG